MLVGYSLPSLDNSMPCHMLWYRSAHTGTGDHDDYAAAMASFELMLQQRVVCRRLGLAAKQLSRYRLALREAVFLPARVGRYKELCTARAAGLHQHGAPRACGCLALLNYAASDVIVPWHCNNTCAQRRQLLGSFNSAAQGAGAVPVCTMHCPRKGTWRRPSYDGRLLLFIGHVYSQMFARSWWKSGRCAVSPQCH